MAARHPDHLPYNIDMNRTIEYQWDDENVEHVIYTRRWWLGGCQGSHPQFHPRRTRPCYTATHYSPQHPRLSLSGETRPLPITNFHGSRRASEVSATADLNSAPDARIMVFLQHRRHASCNSTYAFPLSREPRDWIVSYRNSTSQPTSAPHPS